MGSATIPSARPHSLTRQISRHAMLATLAIVAFIASLTFAIAFDKMVDRRLREISYVTNLSADRFNYIFDSVALLEERASRSMTSYYADAPAEVIESGFARFFQTRADGTARMARGLADGTWTDDGDHIYGFAGVIEDIDRFTLQEKRIFLSAFQTLRAGSGALADEIESFWFINSFGDVVIFAPKDRTLLANLRNTPKESLDPVAMTLAEFNIRTFPKAGMTSCAPLPPLAERTIATHLRTACAYPVKLNGKVIGGFGLNISLDDWAVDVTSRPLTFANTMVVDADGRLVLHAGLRPGDEAAIKEVEARLSIPPTEEEPATAGARLSESGEVYFATAPLNGTTMRFVNIVPRSMVLAEAWHLADQVSLAAILAALLLLFFVHRMLYKVILKPARVLTGLATNSQALSQERIEEVTSRNDEIGALARAFTDRDDRLQRLVDSLESRVSKRTEQLNNAKIAAEQASEAKSRFLATMSHEIRTPMNGILGMASAISQTELSPDQGRMLGVLTTAGDQLLTIINDVLDLSKIEAGHVEIEVLPTHVPSLLDKIKLCYITTAENKGLLLEVVISAAADRWVLVDPTRLRQIIGNLVSNAIKFTQEGSVRVLVDWRDEQLEIAVQDSGPGIAADAVPFIFDAFRQADNTTTRKFGGTGLGLAICRQLTELMDGTLTVETAPGEGAKFTAIVRAETTEASAQSAPLTGEARTAAPETLFAPASDRKNSALNDVRILVAEDNEINQMVLRALAGPRGAKMTFVQNGAEAVEAAMTGTFDLILMDIQMPVMDGMEATRRIRAREQAQGKARTPIISLTADALAEQIPQQIAAGIDQRLTKPLEISKLEAVVADVVSGALFDAADSQNG